MSRQRNEFPFSDSRVLLILALLEDADKSAWQLIRELECRSDRTFRQNEGAIYPLLHGLEERGVLRSYERCAEAGRPRRYYGLTRQGIRTLQRHGEQGRRGQKCAVGGGACVTK